MLMSLYAAMGSNGALTKLGLESNMSSMQKAKLAIKGTFGIPAEIMFRLLSLGDAPFRKFSENYAVYKEAKRRGLGVEGFQVVQKTMETFVINIVVSLDEMRESSLFQFIETKLRDTVEPAATVVFNKVESIRREKSGKMRLIIGING